jgi:large repetitive protein
VTLLGPGGATLFGPTSFGTGGGFVDTETLLAAGTYTLLLDPAGIMTGSTTVTVYDVPADVTGTIAPGSSLTLTTSVPGQNARATFTGAADTGIKLTVGPFNCCSTQVSIIAPDGTTQVPPTGFNPDGGVVLTRLGAAGTYTIVVDPQGPNVGALHLALELDTSAPAPPVLTLTESSPDEHVIGSTLYYRPAGGGGSFVVGAVSSDSGAGLQKVRFPGLAGGFTPTSPVDDTLSPFSQTYSWTTNATYDNAANLVTAFDRVGNTSSTPFGVVPDSTPPTTTDNTAAIGSAWKNTTQFVNLSADDGTGAGASISYYTSDGSTPTTASTQGTSITLSAEGVYTAKYFSVDHVGNVENVKTAGTQVRIDKTSPSSAVLDPLPGTIKNGQVLTGSGADALSGVGSIAYYSCSGSACTPSVLIGSSTAGPTYPVTWGAQPADGTYQVLARVADVAGNTLDSAKRTVVVDNTAPNTTITSQPANPTNQTSATFAFTATEAGSTFECRLDGAAFAACTSPKAYSGLAAGSHTFQVRATDPVGNTDATPASFTWTIDLAPPETTITATPADPSNSTAPSFSFSSSEAGSTFQCSLDGAAFGACTSPKAYSGLVAGSHTFQVRATDPAGNVDGTPASYTWTIDLAAPDTTITSGPANPTNATSASFSFDSTEAGSSFQCRLDGGAFTACTSPKAYTSLAAGSHTFEVRAIDPAGNADPTPAARTWTVDLTPPNTTISSGPANPTNQTSATFAFTATEAGSSFECRLDGVAFAPCSSGASYAGLAAGSHTFEVRATDPAGNTDPSPAAHTWTIDLVVPDTTITSAPANPTNQTSATFAFTATEAGSTFECRVDGAAFTSCTSSKTYTGIAAGPHTFEVRATDPAGNTDPSPASHDWTIDTASPDTSISSGPASPTNQTAATFAFGGTETPVTFECRLDGASFAPCASPKSYSGLTAGTHTFDVRAVDSAGNVDPTPASHAWTVDLAAPDTTITSGPATPTNQTSASFAFSATEPGSTFECRLDGVAFTPCTSGESYTGLAAGAHTFDVRATDPAGNTDQTPASHGWTVDAAPPETAITGAPADPTNLTTAVFSFSSDDAGATFECRLDGAAYAACTSSKTYTALAAGFHTFEVRALDTAGNADPSPAIHTWTIDTTAPDTTIVSGPNDPTNQTDASFAFTGSEAGAAFECNLDFGGWAPCTSPKAYTGLAAASHTFQVRATDPAGNTDPTPAGRTWVVDTNAPETALGSAPPAATSATSATFTFSANEGGSSFECRLDGASFAPCTSPATYSTLPEGSHAFEVRATDPAGNTDATPAVHNWTVDLTAPAAPVVVSPADGTHTSSGTILLSGSAEPSSTVEVFEGAASRGTTNTTVGGSWSTTLTGVADGSHTYTAKATDAAGNTSAASNAVTVVVDTAAPNTTIGTGPLGATKNTTASFTFSADDAGATFECSLDGAGFTGCTSPRTYTGLAEGGHTFEVRATDGAGNTDPTPATRSWTVDLTAPAPPVITSPADGSTMGSANVTVSGTAEPGSIVTVFEGATPRGTTTANGGGSWSRGLTGVADGAHTYTAKATDPAGNVSAASNAITIVVDTTAPETTISSGPAGPTNATAATFDFDSSETGSTFECRLDGAAFAACASPQTYAGLGEGSHTFEVRASDAAGNADPTPAAWTWTVDVTAPETTISSGPVDPTAATDATFEFSADEGGSTFECSLDGAPYAPCTSPQTYTGLAAGSHTFEVRATDAAGNSDGTPASYTWTVL